MIPAVRRETVSVRNAFYVQEDDVPFYDYRKDRKHSQQWSAPPSCKKCLKERSRGFERSKFKYRPKMCKSNTPIVIQLKDTLKAALKQKQRTLAENNTKILAKETNTSVKKRSVVNSKSLKHTRTKNDVKNLSALISVLEKNPEKNHFSSYSNFNQNAHYNYKGKSKFVSDFLLNNSAFSENHVDTVHSKPRNIIDCDNVDIICNDLNSSERSSLTEDTDGEDSSITSSSELQSDSDASLSNHEIGESEMTKEELEQLAIYTTGCPLIRYDCPPAECPHCASDVFQMYYGLSAEDHSHMTHLSTDNCHDGKDLTDVAQSNISEVASCILAQEEFTSEESSETDSSSPSEIALPFDTDISEESIDSSDSPASSASSTSDSSDSNLSSVESCDLNPTTFSSCDPSSKTTALKSDLSLHVNAQCFKSRNPIYSSDHSPRQPAGHQQRQLLDIDIARRGDNSHDNTFYDSVYIDLTNTDVTFTVYYHHDLSGAATEHSSSRATSSPSSTSKTSSSTTDTKYPGYYHVPCALSKYWQQPGYFYQMPAYCMPFSQWSWPYMYPSFCPLPSPLLSSTSTDCVPKTHMVPPHELDACKYVLV